MFARWHAWWFGAQPIPDEEQWEVVPTVDTDSADTDSADTDSADTDSAVTTTADFCEIVTESALGGRFKTPSRYHARGMQRRRRRQRGLKLIEDEVTAS